MALMSVYRGISMFLQLIRYVLLIYCILSWVLPPYNRVMQFLARFMDPVLRPIRNLQFRLFPRLPLDFSAMIALLLISLLDSLIYRLFLLFL